MLKEETTDLKNRNKITAEKLVKSNSGRWKPEEDEIYWFVGTCEIYHHCWINDRADNWMYINHNIFKTKEEAQEYHDYILARAEYTYEFSTEEWEDVDIDKYKIYYDFTDKKIEITWAKYGKTLGDLYFKTEKKAQEFIDKYKKTNIKI